MNYFIEDGKENADGVIYDFKDYNVAKDKQYREECRAYNVSLPIDRYQDDNTSLMFRCNKYHHVYIEYPEEHLLSKGCPSCRKLGNIKDTPFKSITYISKGK